MPHSSYNNPRLNAILSGWYLLPIPDKPSIEKVFAEGLNHSAYLLSSTDRLYVLKLFSKPSPRAIAAQQIAAKAHLAPSIYYVNEKSDVVLLEYIDEQTSAGKNLLEEDLIALAATLRQLHSLPIDKSIHQLGKFDFNSICQAYLDVISPSDQIVYDIHEQLLPVIEQFLNDASPWCFCHNDLVKENCFILPEHALFIDWEYAQINNPWFDLAAILYYFDLNNQQATFFLKHYRPNWEEKIDLPIFHASQCALLWCDILWHLANDKRKKLPNINQKFLDLRRLTKPLGILI